MKLNRTLFALAIALATTLVSGCYHRPANVTNIPDTSPKFIDTQLPPYDPNNQRIAATDPYDPDKWSQDRETFRPYSVHFAYDSAAIRKTEQAKLQAVAATLQGDPSAKLLIEGNCDERGTEEYNRSLGQRRADAAREALSKLGIDPMRIHTLSNGKDKPDDMGHNESAWKQNRRDDFILLHPKTGV